MRASISQVKAFKACRRSWFLRYHEGLIPVSTSDALGIGSSYHKRLEAMELGLEEPGEEFTKDAAMAEAFRKYVLPKLKVVKAEIELEKQIGTHTLHGFLDGIAEDGCIVEHKTTSMDIMEGGEYEYNLLWDEQVLAYMSLLGVRKCYYTVCKKPTIRQKKDETDEEFYHRMVSWYDDGTDEKIRMFVVERTDEEVKAFEEMFSAICDEMERGGNIYRNTCHCHSWGRQCEYAAVCLHYDPNQEYMQYTKKEQEVKT